MRDVTHALPLPSMSIYTHRYTTQSYIGVSRALELLNMVKLVHLRVSVMQCYTLGENYIV